MNLHLRFGMAADVMCFKQCNYWRRQDAQCCQIGNGEVSYQRLKWSYLEYNYRLSGNTEIGRPIGAFNMDCGCMKPPARVAACSRGGVENGSVKSDIPAFRGLLR